MRKTAYSLMALGLMVLLWQWGQVTRRMDYWVTRAVRPEVAIDAAGRSKTVTFWSNSGTPANDLRVEASFERKHPDIDVVQQFQESGSIGEATFIAFVSGNPPDLIQVSNNDLREMVVTGRIRPLDDLLEKQLREDPDFLRKMSGDQDPRVYFHVSPDDRFLREMDRYPREAARLLAMHNKVVGFSTGFGSPTLTYNKRLFREAARMFPDAGLLDAAGRPVPPATWSQLIRVAGVISEYGRRAHRQGLIDKPVYGIVLQGQRERDLKRGIAPLAATAGSRGFDFRGRRWLEGVDGPVGCFDYTDPAIVGALKLLLKLQADGSVLPGTSARHFEDTRAAIGAGQAAMLIDGWHAAMIASDRVPWAASDIGSAPVPVPDDEAERILNIRMGRGKVFRDIATMTTCMTSACRFPEATWQWMHHGMDPQEMRLGMRRGAIPGNMEAARHIDDPDWAPKPYQKQAWQAVQAAEPWPLEPAVGSVGVPTAENVLHSAFLNFSGQEADIERLVQQVIPKLRAYSDAINQSLAQRISEGIADPRMFTFAGFDPANPAATFEMQRRAGRDPAIQAHLEQMRSRLPPDALARGYAFESSTSPWQILWVPVLMLIATGAYATWKHLRGPDPGFTLAATRANWEAYVFVLPGMLFLFTFLFYPSLYQFYLSVHSGTGIGPLQYVGLDNFRRIFAFWTPEWDRAFWLRVLPNTLLYMVVVCAAQIAIAMVLANLLNLPLRGGGVYRTLFFIPMVTAISAVSVVFIGLLKGPDSAFNGMLDWMGLADIPYWLGWTPRPGVHWDWLGHPRTDLWFVMLVGIWHGLPYNIILILAGLQSISPELYEAARVDGASAWRRFLHVTIPELTPILVVIVFNALVGAARAFGAVYVLTEGGSEHSSEVAATYIFKWGFRKLDNLEPNLGYASALGIVYSLFLGTLIAVNVTVIARRWRRRLQPTGAKGAANA